MVRALQTRGETVGFLGDGVNDAPGIRVADVGLSVDGATGVARAAADMILLAPDLNVVADGVEEERRTFANILKYVRMGSSSNFGNMLSMAVASLFLHFCLFWRRRIAAARPYVESAQQSSLSSHGDTRLGSSGAIAFRLFGSGPFAILPSAAPRVSHARSSASLRTPPVATAAARVLSDGSA